MPIIELVTETKVRDELSELSNSIWEIHAAVAGRAHSGSDDSPSQASQSIKNCLSWLLWGQAFIKLSRSYFVPQGVLGKTEFFLCLDLAARKFQQCQSIANEVIKSHRVSPNQQQAGVTSALNAVLTDALCGIAYAHLQKGRHSSDKTLQHQMYIEAKKLFNKAESIRPSRNSTYNLACVAALLDDEYEAKQWLVLCARDGTLPRSNYLQADPDLVNVRTKTWFLDLLRHGAHSVPSQDLDVAKWNTSFQQLSVVLQPLVKDPSAPPAPSVPARAGPVPPSQDPAFSSAIHYDEEMNRLQASLLREGFSKSTVSNMIFEVSKGKQQFDVDNERIRVARERLDARMKVYGMREKTAIAADGNCQFLSISDQLFDSTQRSPYVRRKVVEWLRAHSDWQLPNGAKMRDFVHDKAWEEYCHEISREGIWGDHLTLVRNPPQLFFLLALTVICRLRLRKSSALVFVSFLVWKAITTSRKSILLFESLRRSSSSATTPSTTTVAYASNKYTIIL